MPGSPKVFKIAPEEDYTGWIVGGVTVLIILIVAFRYYTYRKMHNIRKVMSVKLASINAQRVSMEREMQNLHESLRKKKHSDKEIEIMKKAMEEQGKERSDELRQVLIPSKDVKINSIIGQGAFGTVSLIGPSVLLRSRLVEKRVLCV